ncbi:hypothetical protein L3Q72_04465 [Vibrio sp. JC009]|uniref:hypothetical protein n=1 Tax=Vibrio sp. JC009 TaxID=2912314 RepID=UPI0023B1012B|nr:hypothetical protein [Vibrio sp. JC009]WED23337.1 hypothetical protein L3Q72_04465 [Vibrio sp. JC009]
MIFEQFKNIEEKLWTIQYITNLSQLSGQSEAIKIDGAVDVLQQQIEKLKEYKTTLINSAVTGKIKVTDFC